MTAFTKRHTTTTWGRGTCPRTLLLLLVLLFTSPHVILHISAFEDSHLNVFANATLHDGNFKPMVRQCVKNLQTNPNACNSMKYWDISRVTDCSILFWEPTNDANDDWSLLPGAEQFNVDLSGWQTSRCTTMHSMFHSATVFNQPIGQWDVSSITDMSRMFEGAQQFDQDLSAWETSQVTDMSHMFRYAAAFNNGVVGGDSKKLTWTVAQVQSFQYMFHDAEVFQGQIGQWDVSGAKDDDSNEAKAFGNMFQGASAFDGDISQWNVQGARSLRFMFHRATSFNQDLSPWDVQRVTDFTSMFEDAVSFNQTLCWDLTEQQNNTMTTDMMVNTLQWLWDPNVPHSNCPDNSNNNPLEDWFETTKQSWNDQPQSTRFPIVAVMIVVFVAALVLTLQRILRGRHRKRRIIFRKNNQMEEEQILFHEDDNDNNDDGGGVFVDAANSAEDYYLDNAEEGVISFVHDEEDVGAIPFDLGLGQVLAGDMETKTMTQHAVHSDSAVLA